MQRYHRALKERIYLLSAKQNEDNFIFSVRGSSLNIYEQKLDKEKFYCSCPDHITRETFCKHLLFLVGRVAEQKTMARNLCIYSHLWDENHFNIISEDLIERLKKRLNTDTKKNCKEENMNLEDCPICFEKMEGNDDIYKCKNTCNNYFHYDCIKKWLYSKSNEQSTCPLCRSIIIIDDNDSYIDKNVKTEFIT
jgi:hypothetical protein